MLITARAEISEMLSTIILNSEKMETMEIVKIGERVHKLWCKW